MTMLWSYIRVDRANGRLEPLGACFLVSCSPGDQGV
jgi:hypothetical protein